MTESERIKIIDGRINEERRCLKANLKELKDNVNSMLEEFDELDGYELHKKWYYPTHLHGMIIGRTSSIMDLDLVKHRILEREEE